MKKLKDNNFQENSTNENTQIRFNRINNIKIQPKDQDQIEIIINMPVHKAKDRAVDNLPWV